MKDQQDVVIIGAGIIGSAIGLELSRRGYRTVNVDKLPAAGYGSTSNSCSIIRAHYSSREGVAMAYEGFSYWDDWADYLGVVDDFGMARYIRSGIVLLFPRGDRHHERSLAHYEDLGVAYERWDIDEVRRRFPMFDLREFWPPKRPDDPAFHEAPGGELQSAIYNPGAGYVDDPQLATHNLQRAAEAAGGRFEFNQEVVEIHREGDQVCGVSLADGRRLEAGIVVNVAGPHSARINEMAGALEDMNISTRGLRHEVHYVPSPPEYDLDRFGAVISDGDLGMYFRPTTANHILVGSEDPECDERVWVDDADEFDRNVTERQWEAQVYRLARRIPSLKIPNARKGVVDLYDVSDDWLPIYDRSCVDGFYMAIGSSGNQFKNAPVAGHLMAELIEKTEAKVDHDREPITVRSRYTGIELNPGFYSRLRSVNKDSSFSVLG
jgi:glycine/D-amino acid oxidase-like deaminating enzyme